MPEQPSNIAKIPPADLEAETVTLGSLIGGQTHDAADMAPALAAGARREDFYRETNGSVYAACRAMYERGEPIDTVTLAAELAKRGILDRIGGRAQLEQWSTSVPTTANLAHYAAIVREKADRRRLIEVGGRVTGLGYEGSLTASEAISAARSALDEVFPFGETDTASAILARPAVPFPFYVFPPAVQAFGEVLGSAGLGDFVGTSIVVASAAAIGGGSELRQSALDVERAIVWALLVGKNGMGKSPVMKDAARPITEWQRRMDRQHREVLTECQDTGEKPPEPRVFVLEDFTMEALRDAMVDEPATFCLADEAPGLTSALNQFKKGGRGSDENRLLTLWTGNPWRSKRVTGGYKVVDRPTFTVIGGVQHRRLEQMGSGDSGLRPRFLTVQGGPPSGPRPRPSAEVADAYSCTLGHLLELRHVAREWRFEDGGEAQRVMREIEERYRLLAREAEQEAVAELARKAPIWLARFVLVLAELWRAETAPDAVAADGLVDLATVEMAGELLDYFTEQRRCLDFPRVDLTASIGVREVDKGISELLEALRDHPEHRLTRRDIQNRAIAGARAAEGANKLLDRFEAIYPGTVRDGRKPGARGPVTRVVTLPETVDPDTRETVDGKLSTGNCRREVPAQEGPREPPSELKIGHSGPATDLPVSTESTVIDSFPAASPEGASTVPDAPMSTLPAPSCPHCGDPRGKGYRPIGGGRRQCLGCRREWGPGDDDGGPGGSRPTGGNGGARPSWFAGARSRQADPAAVIATLTPDGQMVGAATADRVDVGPGTLAAALDAAAKGGARVLVYCGADVPMDVEAGARLAVWPAAQAATAAGWRFRCYLSELRQGGAGIDTWTRAERGGRRVELVIPALDADVFPADLDAADLHEMALSLSRALGRTWREYPSETFIEMLRDSRGREGMPASELPTATTQSLFGTWEREPTAEEQARPYVHRFDRGASYLTALGRVAVGQGQLERLDAEQARRAWDETPARPGNWRVRQTGPDPALALGLPPLLPGVELGDEAAVPTPTVRLLADFGASFEILGAELWSEWGDYFRPVAERLRAARKQLAGRTDPAGRAAYAAFKLVYSKGLQRLKLAGGVPGRPFHRPDVLEAVTAAARANLLRSLRKAKLPPVAYTSKDSCLWPVDAETPEAAAAEIGLDYGRGIGQWHGKGSWTADEMRAQREAPRTEREQRAAELVARYLARPDRKELARRMAAGYLARSKSIRATVRGLDGGET